MVKIKNLSAKRGGKSVLENISICFEQNKITAIIGKNGSGKSTLCECINQTLPYSGEILFGEKEAKSFSARERARLISFLPQRLESPHITVRELIALGRNPYRKLLSHLTEEDMALCRLASETAEVDSLADMYVDKLSGGEHRRAYLAMVIAQNSEFVVLDEPTTHLDMRHEHLFMSRLLALKEKKSFLVVMHDINAAIKYADNIAVMDDGKLLFFGNAESCIGSGVIENTFGVRKYIADGRVFFAT